jgi:hypothetical protein
LWAAIRDWRFPLAADRSGRVSGALAWGGPPVAGWVDRAELAMVVSALEALMRAAPAFLSAENLLEQVWDEHADPFTNAVFITISRLRRKLGEPPVISVNPPS